MTGCADRNEHILGHDSSNIEFVIGKIVTIEGKVTNTKHPHVNGIGCWALDNFRDKTVRVTGVIERRVVSSEMVKQMNQQMVAHEGEGIFYELVKVQSIVEQ